MFGVPCEVRFYEDYKIESFERKGKATTAVKCSVFFFALLPLMLGLCSTVLRAVSRRAPVCVEGCFCVRWGTQFFCYVDTGGGVHQPLPFHRCSSRGRGEEESGEQGYGLNEWVF